MFRLLQHTLHKKLRWVVNRLIMACKPENNIAPEGSRHLNSSLPAWAWLDTSFRDIQGALKIDILRESILPAISRSNTSQSLLIEITDLLDSMGLSH